MQFETLLDEQTDAEIKILTAAAQALSDVRTDSAGENRIRYRNAINRAFMTFFFCKNPQISTPKRFVPECG